MEEECIKSGGRAEEYVKEYWKKSGRKAEEDLGEIVGRAEEECKKSGRRV